jgi:hypothetical protein
MTDPFEILRTQLVEAAERIAAESRPRWRARSGWGRRGRPRPLAVLVAALVICGSATAAVLSLGGSASQPLSGRVPGRPVGGPPATALRSVAGDRYRITVFPDLSAGAAGWATGVAFSRSGQPTSGGQAGGLYPTAGAPIFGGAGVGYIPVGPQKSASVAFTLTGPEVAAIRFDGRTIRTFTSSQLPTGDRVAVFFLPAGAPAPVPAGSFERIIRGTIRVPAGPGRSWRRIRAAAIVALDAAGRVIPVSRSNLGAFPSIAFWQAPSAVTPTIHEPPYHGPTHPGPGVCELGQSDMPGLTPEWGHTLARITPITGAQGELLLSCIDTHYYLHGWPLTVAVLLNAQHPGAAPGPLPGATPVANATDMVDSAGSGLSGRRIDHAWLIVSGGSGTAQRLRVLAALRISHLKLAR